MGGADDVWFHLIDGLVAMLLPTGDGIMILVELGSQCYGDVGDVFEVIVIR